MIPDDVLCLAAGEAEMILLNSLPHPDDCGGHSFSKGFEHKMKKLLRKTEHPAVYRVLRSAACFILTALLVFGSLLAFNVEVRAAFFGWAQQVIEHYFSYSFSGESDLTLENGRYAMTWVPEGYEEVYISDTVTQCDVIYVKEDDMLTFTYLVGVESAGLFLQKNGVTIEKITINSFSADLYIDEYGGANNIIWTDERAEVIFWLSSRIPPEELIKIAENIELVPKE